ncbi:MAG TPA: hypothetical protein VHH09_00960 [Acidimicrobiales bacterium]|nr:hypothetical protein [Acidimicrobiales bacterium]
MSAPLATYLNDHLAGSMAAVDLAEKAAARNQGDRLGVFLTELLRAIDEDRLTLEGVMDRLGVEKGGPKATAGRVVEKVSRLRLHEKVTGDPDLSRVLEMETLVMGVTGKLQLWHSLQELGPSEPRLADVDLEALVRRAHEQLAGLDEHHREAAARAFTA